MSDLYYEKHVFVCENVREQGQRPSCGRQGSFEILKMLKQKYKSKVPGKKIRVQRSGCLDRCELGPCQVSYPEGVWFSLRNEQDVDDFIQYYLQEENLGKIQHLVIPNDNSESS